MEETVKPETIINYLLEVVRALKQNEMPEINEEYLEQSEEYLLGLL